MHFSIYLSATLLSLALPSLLSAQTGSFTTYGQGCKGTGKAPSTCFSVNAGGGSFRYLAQNTYRFCVPFTVKTSVAMTGFELYTKSRTTSSSATITTRVFASNASGYPTGNPLRTGTMTVNSTLGFHKTTFASPLVLSANTRYFVSYIGSTGIYFPMMSTGTKVSHYWRYPNGSGNWSGPWTSANWAYRVNCASGIGAVPQISNTGTPTIGKTFSVNLSSAKPGTIVALIAGGSKSMWGKIPLPLALTPFGATGCSLHSSFDLLIPSPVLTNSLGGLSMPIPIPSNSSMVLTPIYGQWLIIDPKANKLGLVFSKGCLILPGK